MTTKCKFCLRTLVFVLDSQNPTGTLAIPKEEKGHRYVGIRRQVSKSTEDRARRKHQTSCPENPANLSIPGRPNVAKQTVAQIHEANEATERGR